MGLVKGFFLQLEQQVATGIGISEKDCSTLGSQIKLCEYVLLSSLFFILKYNKVVINKPHNKNFHQ
jgi:hypothetical protein